MYQSFYNAYSVLQNMRNLFLFVISILILSSCANSGNGELVGVKERPKFYQPDPYGMVYVPLGSFTMGLGDDEITFGQINKPKTVSVASFFMDETEITNNEYRQFVYWVRDSIARRMAYENGQLDKYVITEDPKTGEPYDPVKINWKEKIMWNEEDETAALADLFYPENERYFRIKEIDTRKLIYEYWWVDLKAAARKDFSGEVDTLAGGLANRPQGRTDRSVYVKSEKINVYPDTLTWIHDYTYSYNEPLTRSYFWHPTYDNYPVVGVNWNQAKAFCVWRTNVFNNFLAGNKQSPLNEFRLPTEAEWEWAARGGEAANPFPWGGPYSRNDKGCLLANFKNNRGNYVNDGGLYTIVVGHYYPNQFGLYDMAGNVSEWTISAYDEAAEYMTWDVNPTYTYNAVYKDPKSYKRKVTRGGSWKDVEYMLRVSTRDYEYQDSAKCYIGFRCVQSYLGRQKGDNAARSSNVY